MPDVAADVASEAATLSCATAPASKCSPAAPGSVVRGALTFDASHFSAGQNVNLAIFLFHQWTVDSSEAVTGGHPHAYKYVKNVDVSTGQLTFDIDLCELGPAMYSEENCGFNLVVMLDDTQKNNPDVYGPNAFLPRQGELVKLTQLNVSCMGDSQCLTISADCTAGQACTTYTPITMSSCVCSTQHCPSTSVVCHYPPSDAGAD
jgi:hypothetical protein